LIVLKEEVLLKLTETTKQTKCLKLLLNVGYMDTMLDMTAILDAILNYTFLPHIWNDYPSFFQSPMGPLQGSRVKIGGHIIAHRTPLSPWTNSFSCCCLLKLRNHAKFRQKLTLQQFKVIQGHWSWCQSKAHMRIL